MANHMVQAAIDSILEGILHQDFPIAQALPNEQELARQLQVSRPTIREAIRTLATNGVLRVVHGRGTYVNNPQQWSDLSMIIWWISHTQSPQDLGIALVELRRMIEVGACGLAAVRRQKTDLEKMRTALMDYDKAIEIEDIEAATSADLRFHQAILDASGNPLLSAIMQPLTLALHNSRKHTTGIPEVRERARQHHKSIFQAIEIGNPNLAKEAMRTHMTQTATDINNHLPKK